MKSEASEVGLSDWAPFMSRTKTKTEAIEAIHEYIRDNESLGIMAVYLFGSYSNSAHDEYSDVDVLIIAKNTPENQKLQIWRDGYPLQIIFIREREVINKLAGCTKSKNPFFLDIILHGEVIYSQKKVSENLYDVSYELKKRGCTYSLEEKKSLRRSAASKYLSLVRKTTTSNSVKTIKLARLLDIIIRLEQAKLDGWYYPIEQVVKENISYPHETAKLINLFMSDDIDGTVNLLTKVLEAQSIECWANER
ncbi:nucleotidyltransferase domain-containing protein [Pseudomonas kuykendallii]|jgi:predicted nucleotidyltransferase|uniref:Polymerase beta nucleotidyltransferase domain-containing protein n=1 Tax=Pseudomonas kuykendallii TaxID=1007099 RepID=A0A2W5CTT7_9PSED|nr:nucleotidyltransferase domain-containing protein [Pseudomonas kuykendallii]PZP20744.1 MAG: hypothetical protein DI599_21515 [Pseudomonas kuykendallii]